jgi:hypothetical protein
MPHALDCFVAALLAMTGVVNLAGFEDTPREAYSNPETDPV